MKRHGEKVLNTGDVIQVRGVHHGEFDELYVLPTADNVDAAAILDQERNIHDLLRTGTDT